MQIHKESRFSLKATRKTSRPLINSRLVSNQNETGSEPKIEQSCLMGNFRLRMQCAGRIAYHDFAKKKKKKIKK